MQRALDRFRKAVIAGEKVLDTVQKAQGPFELAQTEVTQAQAEMELLMKEARLPVVSSLSDRHTCGQNLGTLSW